MDGLLVATEWIGRLIWRVVRVCVVSRTNWRVGVLLIGDLGIEGVKGGRGVSFWPDDWRSIAGGWAVIWVRQGGVGCRRVLVGEISWIGGREVSDPRLGLLIG